MFDVFGGEVCMSSVPVDMLDYYDEEVVRRIIEKYGYGCPVEAIENAFADLDGRLSGTEKKAC